MADDLNAWYADQYKQAIGLEGLEGTTRYRTALSKCPERSTILVDQAPLSGRQRMLYFMELKFRYPIGQQGYTCMTMGIQHGDQVVHYAYAYWRHGEECAEPEYICISPTYDSRDGEYRRRFIRYAVFAEKYEELCKELEPFELLAMGLHDRTVQQVYPPDETSTVKTDAHSRLHLVALSVALALDLWELKIGLLMVHTSLPYLEFLNWVIEQYGDLADKSLELQRAGHLLWFRVGVKENFTVQCGQKIVPMYIRETINFLDFNLASWRELAVTQLVGDLVINFVSPSFSLYNQWTYIEGVDASLFENKAMAERYSRGSSVDAALQALRDSRRLIRDSELPQIYQEVELDAHIYESLEYAQSFLLLSPNALLHTMEDVGITLQSLGQLVRRTVSLAPAFQMAFSDKGTAARNIFEWVYGAHCLHTKLGVAHTDLHSNNLTIYRWGLNVLRKRMPDGSFHDDYFYKNPKVLYVTGPAGEKDTYCFPANGTSACIIDYSRAILGPAFRPRLEHRQSAQYATNFYHDQVNRVMRVFVRYAPLIVKKNQEAIKAAVMANFEAAFPVLCAVDFVAIARTVAATLEFELTVKKDEYEKRPHTIDPAAIKLARHLETVAHEVFITGIHDLISGNAERLRTAPYPGEHIIRTVFAQWAFHAQRDPEDLATAQYVDAYNYNNELRFAGMDYARWPQWGRLDVIEPRLGEYKMSDLVGREVEPFLEALKPGARVEIIADRVRAEQERKDGDAVSANSSWFDE